MVEQTKLPVYNVSNSASETSLQSDSDFHASPKSISRNSSISSEAG